MASVPPLPPVPPYGRRSLPDLLPAVAAALGVPGARDVLGLGPVRAACVLLVDGLGWGLLRAHPAEAPFLTGLLDGAEPLAAGCPSTTATSLASLGVGAPPGVHGLVGYEMAVPGERRVLNALSWDGAVDPYAWQPEPTVFERATAAGVAVTRVGPGAFEGTGLTVAALRGGRAAAAETPGELAAAAAAALRAPGPALVYVYTGDLDATGHRVGCGSGAWRHQLAHVDLLAAQLAAALPPGAALWVTADHGMVDVPPDDRLDVAAVPALADGVELLAGEARARHVHTRPGAAADVRAAWAEVLGGRAWVLGRDEAVELGLFGPRVEERVRPRVGDVVALASGSAAVVDSRRDPPALLGMVGMHGSLTDDELLVPLLEVRA